jgi:crotonobetainyl-CoA:carnitine CoA-transferase CaiB-like acyl-CoA transferase
MGKTLKSGEDISRFIRAQRSEEVLGGLPLQGVRVLDMATVVAAPYAATLMGDFGAEVIKIENPRVPDAPRIWFEIEPGIHPYWAYLGRNKFPVTLNLKSEQGKKIFLELVEKSDVLLENMRSGALEKLGLDMDTLHKHNPGLVIGRLSGFGQTGPYASKSGFGTLAEGFAGFTHLNAPRDGDPLNAPVPLSDFLASLHLLVAVMICLRDQKRGEKGGRVIDISLYEPLFGLFGGEFVKYFMNNEVPQPLGSEWSLSVPRNTFKTKDGKWVTMTASVQRVFERLMNAIGHPEMIDDPRFKTNEVRLKEKNRRVVNKVIAEWIESKELEDLIETCSQLDVALGPIYNMEDIARDPHYKARGSLVDIEDPITETPIRMPNVPFRILGAQGKIRFPGLPLGAANEVILEDLGYSLVEIKRLKDMGHI